MNLMCTGKQSNLWRHRGLFALVALCAAGCFEGPRSEGLRATQDTGGPKIIFDALAEGLPEIPMPNDMATRLDPTSPTGRRLNVSEVAPTELERTTRRKFNDLDGFGTFAPITVSFDRALDLEAIQRRHLDNNDFRDDAVFVLNVDPECERYGEEVGLDMGRGRFPVTLYKRASVTLDPEAPKGYRRRRDGLFSRSGADPHGTDNNLLFEERNEDFNGNGQLDPGEDLDYDGHLDGANFIDPQACDALALHGPDGQVNPGFDQLLYDTCVADNLLTWYERESDTLILRPIWPLEQRCTYAVVLSDRLKDAEGRAVMSPLPGVNHRDQTQALQPVEELLRRYGLTLDNVAFAWTFTTGSMTHDLEALRAGLYGHGVFAELQSRFPTSTFQPWSREELNEEPLDDPLSGTPAYLQGACAGAALTKYWNIEDEWEPNRCAIEADMSSVGGIFGGQFKAPTFLTDKDGVATERYPSDDDESWKIDLITGEGPYGETDVTFWCALPQEKATCEPGNPEGKPFCKPFPTILYAHGYGGSRAEIAVGHLGRTTAMGYAMCALDAYGHGLNALDDDSLQAMFFEFQLQPELDRLGIPELRRMMLKGRDRDLNNDGVPDSGADMWTSDVFHTRDMVRQSVLEVIQFVRILRSMDGVNTDAYGNKLGDLDGDGEPDLGGPQNTISMWGISLGGIISGVAAGAEPTLNAVSPNAGGAGLVDIAVRSSQQGVPQAVVMPILGPFVVGCLPTDRHQNPLGPDEVGEGCFSGDDVSGDTLELAFLVHDNAREHERFIGRIEGVRPGDRLVLSNLSNAEEDSALIDAWGNVRVSVAADALRPIERRGLLGLEEIEPSPVEVDDALVVELGDRLALKVLDDAGQPRGELNTFEERVEFQGTIYPSGVTLVAIQEGLGLKRNTPEYRRFMGFAQSALGPADPAAWSARATVEPGDHSYDPNWRPGMTHVLHMPTAGDQQVPVNTGIAMARAGGLYGSWRRTPEAVGPEHGWREIFVPEPSYGVPVDELMIDRFVVEGDPRFLRFPDNEVHTNVVYDIDNVSDGAASFSCGPSDWSGPSENGCPSELEGQEIFFTVPHPEAPEPPLRRDVQRPDGSYDAVRVPVLRPAGQHGIYNAQPFRVFDADAFMVNFTTRFLGTRGGSVSHEAGCDCSASALPNITLNGESITPALDRECTPGDMRLCEASCAQAWGIETPSEAACEVP